MRSAKPHRRRKAGAPRGNRNALKTGCHTAKMKALRARTKVVITRLRLVRALAEALLARNRERARMLDG